MSARGVIAQHARGDQPDFAHGFCTDDVARAIEVDLKHGAVLGWDVVASPLEASLGFLEEAFISSTGGFRNVRDVSGRWLDAGSEDCVGRAISALGHAAAHAGRASDRDAAVELLERALPAASGLTSLRAIASAAIGCAVVGAGSSHAVDATGFRLAQRLEDRWGQVSDPDWPWPEAVATYSIALPVEALLRAGRRYAQPMSIRLGLRLLDWITGSIVQSDGVVSFVGNDGWWTRDGVRARFDQQPIEAVSTALAAQAALEVTGDARHAAVMEAAYGWFLGENEGRIPLADMESGGCHDGLTPTGPNDNQGAESTLAWLMTVEVIRELRSHRSPEVPGPGQAAGAGLVSGSSSRSR
jgi:hypothetical protein